jgi:hypothetical protein
VLSIWIVLNYTFRMENILLVMVIGNMVAVLMLFMELKNLQERITTYQNGAVQLINTTVNIATKEFAQRLPLLEQRLERITQDFNHLHEKIELGTLKSK